MNVYSRLMVITVGVLGLLLVNGCAVQKQEGPVIESIHAPQTATDIPADRTSPEAMTRADGEVNAEATLGFHISGWT